MFFGDIYGLFPQAYLETTHISASLSRTRGQGQETVAYPFSMGW